MTRLLIVAFGTALAAGLLLTAWLLERATLEEDRVALARQFVAQLPAIPSPAIQEAERRTATLAIELFDRVLSGAPDHHEALRGRARARLVLGDWSGAREDVEAVARGPARAAVDLALLGALALRDGRDREAQAAFDEARALKPAEDPAALAAAWVKIVAREPALRDPARGWRELAAAGHLLPSRDDRSMRPAVGVWFCCFREPARVRELVERAAEDALERGEIDEQDLEQILRLFREDRE